jgi:hypothetical protein
MDAQCTSYSQSLLTVKAKVKISRSIHWMSPTCQYIATSSEDLKTVSFLDARIGNQRGPDLRFESSVEAAAWPTTAEHIVTLTKDIILRKWSNVFDSATVVAEAGHDHVLVIEFHPMTSSSCLLAVATRRFEGRRICQLSCSVRGPGVLQFTRWGTDSSFLAGIL